jgi:hypothetical protein
MLAGLPAAAAESKQTQIDRAMSAAPARVAASATILYDHVALHGEDQRAQPQDQK